MSKKPKPPNEDQEQSKRFQEAVRSIEADGSLSPTAAEDFERVFRKVAPEKKPKR